MRPETSGLNEDGKLLDSDELLVVSDYWLVVIGLLFVINYLVSVFLVGNG